MICDINFLAEWVLYGGRLAFWVGRSSDLSLGWKPTKELSQHGVEET
jgi:hypothetical protein